MKIKYPSIIVVFLLSLGTVLPGCTNQEGQGGINDQEQPRNITYQPGNPINNLDRGTLNRFIPDTLEPYVTDETSPAGQPPAPAPTPYQLAPTNPGGQGGREVPNNEAQNGTIKQIELQVIELTNRERQRNGLSTLNLNSKVSEVARLKSQDMRDQNFFSHQSPTYGSPFQMMRNFHIQYTTAGENIAAGQRTAEEVFRQWMESPGHRKNILNPQFTQIGVGYVQGGRMGTYWTQMFIKPR